MNKFELWLLKKLVRKSVRQGFNLRLLDLYVMIDDAARDEFNEDNKPTLDAFLTELHQDALNS